ncbi:family 16 glycosylhydrolase [Sphingomonas sanguinis]|uniref:family 16 glycosylhydrolase n=1 Tax=Sphingomonas sanguinis TaxID=33051 RepID=UPI001C5615B9|nr:family 16 glycosylhydrolase [Sphingomonas sanguinis]QXT37372.1 family 16 glycosylhydrolase [Sphingomonas sanguinis]
MKTIYRALTAAALMMAPQLAPRTAMAQSFWDGFDSNSYNPNLWIAESGRNGDPFGCTFQPGMIVNGQGGNVALTLQNGSCSELKSKALYQYGTVQARLQLSNIPGTVASLFTYNSWYDSPGKPWTEIDIEYLPSYGNTLHTNVIFQASQTGTYRQWEKYVSLDGYGINPMNGPVTAGFDWTASKIAWYVINGSGNKVYIRTITKSDQTNCDCIPASAWPSNPARIFANYWHGNNANSDSVNYFPKRYSGASGRAVYDWIQFIDY